MDSNHKRRSSSHSPSGHAAGFLNSFLTASLAFLAVVLTHQLLLATFSFFFNYETHVSFVKVISKPYANRFWSDARVLLLYASPSVLFLTSAAVIAYGLLFFPKKITNWYRFRFWWMVFSILYVSAQVTMAPLAVILSDGPFYTGLAVVAKWWGVDIKMLFLCSCLSVGLNLIFGFITARVVIRFASSRHLLAKQSGKNAVIWQNYFLPLLLQLPMALFLSYPHGMVFFAIVLLHGILWLPGFYLLKGSSIIKRGYLSTGHMDVYQFEEIANDRNAPSYGIKLPVLILGLTILIRIFL